MQQHATRDYHTKQSEIERHTLWYRLYGKSKIWHKLIYETDSQTSRTDLWWTREGSRGINWIFAVSRCKLLYKRWKSNKVLLWSTRNYIQYPVINHNGKEWKKEYIYVYLNHFAVQQKITQHCKPTVLQFLKKEHTFWS